MSKVVIQECSNYDTAEIIEKVNKGINIIGGWNKFIKPGVNVLLKVNLIGPKTSDSAAITHSEFVRALVRILKSKQCNVWIGDSSGGAIAGIAPTAQSFKVSELEKVGREEGAEIKNFDREGVIEIVPESNFVSKMYLAKPFMHADVVINLPKLKTHAAGIYTGAVKNLFGCIPGLKKAEYHKMAPDPEKFGEIIVDINRARKINLNIMDAITAMDGEGPTAGGVYKANKILISEDALAIDAVAARMINLDLEQIPILKKAKYRKLGEWDLTKIQILGDYQSAPNLINFKLPQRLQSSKKQNYKALIKVIDFLKARPKINLKKCKGCNMCVESCPVQAIDRNIKKIDYNKCIECMCCHELCLHKAVEIKKEHIIAELVSKLYRGNYK